MGQSTPLRLSLGFDFKHFELNYWKSILVVSLSFCLFSSQFSLAGETDCNNNGIPDQLELVDQDCDGNGILDECDIANCLNEPICDDCNDNEVLDICEIDGFAHEYEYALDENDDPYVQVALYGDWMAVGLPSARDEQGQRIGKVTLYRFEQNQWVETQTLLGSPVGLYGSSFGIRLRFVRNRLLIHASEARIPSLPVIGVFYLYEFDVSLNEWVLAATIAEPTNNLFTRFGADFAFDGSRLLVYDKAGTGILRTPRYLAFEEIEGVWIKTQEIFPDTFWNDNSGIVAPLRADSRMTLSLYDDTAVIFQQVVYPNSNFGINALILSHGTHGWRLASKIPVSVEYPMQEIAIGGIEITKNRIVIILSQSTSPIVVIDKVNDEWVLDSILPPPAGWSDDFRLRSARVGDRIFLAGWNGKEILAHEVVNGNGGVELVLREGFEDVFYRGVFSGNRFAQYQVEENRFFRIFDFINDCDGDGLLDQCELSAGATDVDRDLVPDSCQPDCNGDGVPDSAQIAGRDCNANGILDECDVNSSDPDGDGMVSADCNQNGMPDSCEADCDANGVPDDCDIDVGDPDGDGRVALDCNSNGLPDTCDIRRGLVPFATVSPGADAQYVRFGESIMLEGSLLIVAAPTTFQSQLAGRVYVYRFDDSDWVEEAILVPSESPGQILFANRIAVANDRIFVYLHDESGSSLSRINIYEFGQGGWEQTGIILLPDGSPSDVGFAAHGDELVVYLPFPDFATLFRLIDGVWVPIRDFQQPYFGFGNLDRLTVAMNESHIYFGSAPNQILFAYEKNGDALFDDYVELKAFNPTQDMRLQLNGDEFAVGYPEDRSYLSSVQHGTVYFGSVHQGGLFQEARTSVEDIQERAQGSAIALTDNRLIVGVPGFDGWRGRVKLYDREGAMWTLRETFDSPVQELATSFGTSIASSESFFAVSAVRGPQNPEFNRVYIYHSDLDVDNDGLLDSCEDCDGNRLPDDWERQRVSIDDFVAILLSDSPTCAFDFNGDDATNGLDVAGFVSMLLTP